MTSNKRGILDFEIEDVPPSSEFEEQALDISKLISDLSKEEKEEPLTFSNKAVKRAGRNLRKEEGDLKKSRSILQLYRAAHEKPLNTVASIIDKTSQKFTQAKTVRRLKRLDTIVDKLQRDSLDGKSTNQTCVSNMADIGGCRLILKDLPTLEAVRKELEQSSQLKKRLYIEKTNDYIQSPKGRDCGYRCLHLIYRYKRSDERSFKIEAQLRTELQHVWATTVEIIDVIEHTNIKTHSHAPDENKLEKQR